MIILPLVSVYRAAYISPFASRSEITFNTPASLLVHNLFFTPQGILHCITVVCCFHHGYDHWNNLQNQVSSGLMPRTDWIRLMQTLIDIMRAISQCIPEIVYLNHMTIEKKVVLCIIFCTYIVIMQFSEYVVCNKPTFRGDDNISWLHKWSSFSTDIFFCSIIQYTVFNLSCITNDTCNSLIHSSKYRKLPFCYQRTIFIINNLSLTGFMLFNNV